MPDIDLDAYLARIGYTGPRAPTLDVLRTLQLKHLQTIPFENLDPLLGRPVRLDFASLEGKLVRGGRGGYCFEQNLLFHAVLQALGFEATCLGGRVYLDRPPEAGVASRTHLLVQVEIDGTPYLADVGFGGQSPTGPLLLQGDGAQETPHEPYRIMPAGGSDREAFSMEACVAGAWKLLYRFALGEPPPIDREVANHYVATHDKSPFRNGLLVARTAPEGRHTLLNDRLSFHRLGGETERRMLPDADALMNALTDIFGLTIPDDAALAAAFERLRKN